MGAYTATYQWNIQPVPSQEFWETEEHARLLPPVYRKPIGRPTTKRKTSKDGPIINPDPYKTKRRYVPITCKYCFQIGHNSRSCEKKKEAMGRGYTTASEMYWEETLEEVEVETSAHEMNVVNSVTPTLAPTPVRPPPIRPPINLSIPKKSYKKRNFKRPPPSQPSSLRPVAPQPCPLRPQSTTVRPQTMPPPPSFQPHPIVSMHTMHGASAGTTSRFNQFMPTPGTRTRGSSTIRWSMPRFIPPARTNSSKDNNIRGSSGSSNSTLSK
ncbi:hypothetical protein PIB30_014280 [Stylosanthes scabra]|uniref:Uncharacterized protein n=1 Tax=Stylosanthes scabra TaxID=79078 RepID=A0ABU6Z655_9FABA|nr:hypothetical protein [Stylosanthes scabra]